MSPCIPSVNIRKGIPQRYTFLAADRPLQAILHIRFEPRRSKVDPDHIYSIISLRNPLRSSVRDEIVTFLLLLGRSGVFRSGPWAAPIAPQDGPVNIIRALHHRLASPEEIISEVDRVLSSVMDGERSHQNAKRLIARPPKSPDANAESNNPIAVILNAAKGLSAEARIAEVDARDAELKGAAPETRNIRRTPSPPPKP
ncbi:MAG: hypothetical protein SFU53_13140 [Terrimicrobiaceae bacterium]|nr:hypothetical protein [Terrimicrobiaceae bacterium]